MADRINLLNDYNAVAHPAVLEALLAASGRRYSGYGADGETEAARAAVRCFVARDDAQVHFLPGGTQTNLTAIAAFLRPHEAVIAPATAHICGHETGAVEATGHKVLTVEATDGKALPQDVERMVAAHQGEHTVRPRLLFLSQATELGTVYTHAELLALRAVCDRAGLYLYIDGARLGSALAAGQEGAGAGAGLCASASGGERASAAPCAGTGASASIEETARIADAFYIGGTKSGLLFGEALVLCNPALAQDFRWHIKQRGGLLAKGFLLGIQFSALLEGGLYLDLARRANRAAARLVEHLRTLGCTFAVMSPTNQIFPVVSREAEAMLARHVLFEHWGEQEDGGQVIRFVTTWQTTDEEVDAVAALLRQGG
ncbi:MAG: aminotransferase class I/II-fold pyridoxal phosphate-dependent enzyme [Clostridiales Family XIII bacterium]|jgi:threonine aldolase|nr:aminotransferase class I/II-fold pyridoxal phosphate-dependent enzyme [Clostridiales Family XIII bacterium]